jgi:hypothetical protein
MMQLKIIVPELIKPGSAGVVVDTGAATKMTHHKPLVARGSE